MHDTPLTGLVLSGGGARAAYQVGVLKAVMRLRREALAAAGSQTGTRRNPFAVITGTSAGAINAAALACNADDMERAVQGVAQVWENFSADQVYRADSFGVIRTGAQWLTMLSIGWAIRRWRRARPRSLLDNGPLRELLHGLVQFERLPRLLRGRHLHALAVTASSYTSGLHATFYESAMPILPWTRSQRVAISGPITTEHLLASSAIPFVFPATPLLRDGSSEWFGDGSMRQTAPISPAIHLGAQRVLIIGAGRMHEPPSRHVGTDEYPSPAQIAGHTLSSIFLDALAVDVERMQRINATLALLPPEARIRTPLRQVDALVIAPSQRLDDIAARHIESMPGPVRALLRGVGVSRQGASSAARGAALASYLLFEAPYTRELVALGEADTLARGADVARFFGWPAPLGAGASAHWGPAGVHAPAFSPRDAADPEGVMLPGPARSNGQRPGGREQASPPTA